MVLSRSIARAYVAYVKHCANADAPSGTVRELTSRRARVLEASPTIAIDETVGERDGWCDVVEVAGTLDSIAWFRDQCRDHRWHDRSEIDDSA